MAMMAFGTHARIRLGALLWFALALSMSVQSAAAQEPPSAEWLPEESRRITQELRELKDSPLAIAPLLDLSSLQQWMTASQADAQLMAARATVRDPRARAWADYARLRFFAENRQAHKLRALEKDMGFVTHWLMTGPFRNDGMSGFSNAYAPELDGFQNQEQHFIGKFSDLRWLPIERSSETGYIAAHETIGDASTAVIYAVSECEFSSTPSEVHLAVDGAYKLWLNEQPVAMQETNLGGVFLRDSSPVKATRGWNRIFLKVASDRVDPGWHMRFVDRRGRSVVSNCRAPQSSTSPVVQTDDFPVAQTISDQLRALESDAWTDQDRTNAAYILRTFHREDPAEPWKYFLEQVSTDALSATHKVRAARSELTRWQKMLRVDDVDVRKDSVGTLLYALQLRAGDVGLHARQDVTLGVQALRQRLEDPRVELQWLEYLSTEIRSISVAQQLIDLLEAYGPRPALCRRVFDKVARRDDATQALYEACADRALSSVSDVKNYLSRLATIAKLDAVHQAMEDLEPIWSGRVDWLRLKQMVAAFEADWTTMLATIDEEIERRPHHANAYVRRADALTRLSRNDDAAADLRTAIDLKPQLQSARDKLSFLEVQGERFYDKWRVDDETLWELAGTLDLEGYNYGVVVNQRVNNIYPGGLSSRYFEYAYAVQTREGAEQLRQFSLGFVPGQRNLEVLSARVLRPDGSTRETFESRDYQPYTGPSAMYGDVHTRSVTLSNIQVGDIVVLEYVQHEVGQQNMFDDYFGALWVFDSQYPAALARFVLYSPADTDIYVERSGEEIALESSEEGGRVERVYEERDIEAIASEASTPGYTEIFRYLHATTYKDIDTLANWYWNLIKDQMTTSPEMIQTVQELIDGVDDRRTQVSRIYNYVVQNTRYVSMAFGIGGFRPHRTTSCFSQRYGDCKDTASLLKVMLGIADIPSHLVLIRTREGGRVFNHLPSLELFNHAITYVPEFDLYLDGTASYSGSDELTEADQGATAVIILDGEGGDAVITPFLPAENKRDELRAVIDARGATAHGRVHRRFVGEGAAGIRSVFSGSDQKRKVLENWLARSIPKITVETAEFNGLEDLDTPAEYDAQVKDGRWLQKRGEEYVLLPFGFETFSIGDRASTSTRTLPLSLPPPETTQRHLEIRVPDGYTPTQIHESETTIEDTDFGRFVMTVAWDETHQRLVVDGRLVRHVTTVTPEDYPRFRTWAREIQRTANKPILFHDASTR